MSFRPEHCKKDEAFAGSLFEQMGLSPCLCGRCGAHLKETAPDRLICLNGCHLGDATMQRFSALIDPASERKP